MADTSGSTVAACLNVGAAAAPSAASAAASSAPISAVSTSAADTSASGCGTPDTITLVTSDGVPFAVDSTVARECELLRAVLGDEDEAAAAATTESIPLALVTAPTLARVLEYYYGTAEEQHAGLVNRWTTEELCQVMLAADYLGADKLLMCACKHMVAMIASCQSLDDIRVRFGIVGDLPDAAAKTAAAVWDWLLPATEGTGDGSIVDLVAAPAAAATAYAADAARLRGFLFADAVFCLAQSGFEAEAARCVYVCSDTLQHDALCQAISKVTIGEKKRTYLMAVSKAGDLKAAEWWLQHGADINAPDKLGCTPLHHASETGHEALVERLVGLGADINAKTLFFERTPLLAVCGQLRLGLEGVALRLIERGADVNATDHRCNTPLHAACESGHESVVLGLLDAGADINAKSSVGSTPLHEACRGEHTHLALLLLERGADINANNCDNVTVLNEACRRRLASVALRLLELGADARAADSRGSTPLHEACRRGLQSVAARLLERGADVNTKDSIGDTPLLAASGMLQVSVAVALLLLDHGAAVNVVGYGGITPLLLACCSADAQVQAVAHRLLDLGADVNAKRMHGWTPLLVACATRAESVALRLLELGADANAADNWNATPLQTARQQGLTAVVQRMMQLSAAVPSAGGDGGAGDTH